MGRRKIDILPLENERNRSVTFLKRKAGLFKKAYELAVLCQVDIAVVIFGNNNRLYEFASTDLDQIVDRCNGAKSYESKRLHDFALDKHGDHKDLGDDDDEDDKTPSPALSRLRAHSRSTSQVSASNVSNVSNASNTSSQAIDRAYGSAATVKQEPGTTPQVAQATVMTQQQMYQYPQPVVQQQMVHQIIYPHPEMHGSGRMYQLSNVSNVSNVPNVSGVSNMSGISSIPNYAARSVPASSPPYPQHPRLGTVPMYPPQNVHRQFAYPQMAVYSRGVEVQQQQQMQQVQVQNQQQQVQTSQQPSQTQPAQPAQPSPPDQPTSPVSGTAPGIRPRLTVQIPLGDQSQDGQAAPFEETQEEQNGYVSTQEPKNDLTNRQEPATKSSDQPVSRAGPAAGPCRSSCWAGSQRQRAIFRAQLAAAATFPAGPGRR